jgi:uncharacterized protein GlcG (DUF336 family)
MAGIARTSDITLELAQSVVAASVRRAQEADLLMNVAVVDAGSNLKAFARMDGAWLGSIDIAVKKARTARYFDMETAALSPMAQPGASLYNIEFSNGGLITFPGGIPLQLSDGTVVGAVGVSGGAVDEDQSVAEAGAAAFQAALAT